MAQLIPTGKHEAILLKTLRGEQVLMLDEAASEAPSGNCFLLIAMRDRVLQFLRTLEPTRFYPLKPGRKRAEA